MNIAKEDRAWVPRKRRDSLSEHDREAAEAKRQRRTQAETVIETQTLKSV